MADLYLFRKEINEVIENIFIGIEIETCFGVESYDYYYLEDAHKQYYQMFRDKLNDLPDAIYYDVYYLDAREQREKNTNYNRWVIMWDESVKCNTWDTPHKAYRNGKELTVVKKNYIHEIQGVNLDNEFWPTEKLRPRCHFILAYKYWKKCGKM